MIPMGTRVEILKSGIYGTVRGKFKTIGFTDGDRILYYIELDKYLPIGIGFSMKSTTALEECLNII